MSIHLTREERRTLYDLPGDQESHLSRNETRQSHRSEVQDKIFMMTILLKYTSNGNQQKTKFVSKLTGMFGTDASSADNSDVGLCLDASQKKIINKSWRVESLSAYKKKKENCKTLFLVLKDN